MTFGDPFAGVLFTSVGSPDSTSGETFTGMLSLDFGGEDVATVLVLDNVGNIVVAGNVGGNGTRQDVGVARFFSNGQIDRSFGVNGQSVFDTGTALSSNVGSLAVRPSGDVRVGFASVSSQQVRFGGTVSFDANGRVVGSASSTGRTSANGLADTPTDSLVLGGTSTAGPAPELFYVSDARRRQTNVGFGSTTDHNVAGATTVGPDGKIIQVGSTTAGGGGRTSPSSATSARPPTAWARSRATPSPTPTATASETPTNRPSRTSASSSTPTTTAASTRARSPSAAS